ncbi:hypothetical protein Tco_0575202 [Tanacetum coccineum]
MPRQRHINKRVPPANVTTDVALPRRLTWDPHLPRGTTQVVTRDILIIRYETGGSGIITAVYDEVAGSGSEAMISQSLSINVAVGMTK